MNYTPKLVQLGPDIYYKGLILALSQAAGGLAEGKKMAEEKINGKTQPKQFKYKTCDFVDGNYIARFWLKEPAKNPAEPPEA